MCAPYLTPPLPSKPPPPSEPELITDPTGQGAGCVLCKASDFLRGGFGDRTIMICDTCEREFHVDCLRSAGRCDLTEVGVRGGMGEFLGGAAGEGAAPQKCSWLLVLLSCRAAHASLTPVAPHPAPRPARRRQLPAGDWYCCCECAVVRDQLDLWVQQGDVGIGAAHSLQVGGAAFSWAFSGVD
jgi:hypothetical protein